MQLAGDVEAARTSYKAVTDVLAPGLLSAILQAASFERRNNNLEAAKKLFEAALSIESGAEGKLTRPCAVEQFHP